MTPDMLLSAPGRASRQSNPYGQKDKEELFLHTDKYQLQEIFTRRHMQNMISSEVFGNQLIPAQPLLIVFPIRPMDVIDICR